MLKKITKSLWNFQVGDYSVSLKAPGRNKHFRVQVEGNLYCIGQRKFTTLDQLVAHYQRAPIYTNKQGEKLYLVRPLPRAAANCWAGAREAIYIPSGAGERLR